MPWQTPKTDWTPVDGVADADLIRIEGNVAETAPAKAQAAGDLFVATGLNAIKRLALGAAARFLRVNSGATDVEWHALTKSDVGLGNVDNVRQAPLVLAVNAQTANYTLVLADGDGKLVTMDSASARTITVPPNSSVAFPIGTQILVQRLGTGDVTLVAGSGVTLQSADGALKLRVQHSVAGLVKRLTDTWAVFGDVSA